MKKFTALFLAILMVSSVTAFASTSEEQICEVEQRVILDTGIIKAEAINSYFEVQQVQPRNINYITFNHMSYANGYSYFPIRPGIGEHLKLHIYLEGGSMEFWIKEVGKYYWVPIEGVYSNGHHYRDLVYGTSGKQYDLRVVATNAYYSGGVYSGI